MRTLEGSNSANVALIDPRACVCVCVCVRVLQVAPGQFRAHSWT